MASCADRQGHHVGANALGTQLRQQAVLLPEDTLLSFLSPLGWEQINLTGDYHWRHSARVGAGKFGPLKPAPRP